MKGICGALAMSLILLSFASTAWAQEEMEGTNESPAVSFTLSSVALSKYVFAETGENIYDKPVLQSELLIETRWGIYVSMWHSMGFDSNLSEDAGDEIDYYLGWAGDIGQLSLDVGVAYFDSVDLFHGPADDTYYMYAQVGHTFSGKAGSITPLIKGNFYVNGTGSEVEGRTVFVSSLVSRSTQMMFDITYRQKSHEVHRCSSLSRKEPS